VAGSDSPSRPIPDGGAAGAGGGAVRGGKSEPTPRPNPGPKSGVCVCDIACKYERGRVCDRVCVKECDRLCMCERESRQSVCRRERPGVHVCVEERVRRCASVYERRVAGC